MMENKEARDYGEALRIIRNEQFLATTKYQDQQWRANREGAHPRILEFSDAMVKRCRNLGVPIFPLCIVRTFEEQQSAYVRGVSRDSPADGVWPHQAFAVDLIHSVLGYKMAERSWDILGHIGMEEAGRLGIPIRWGGDWDGDGDKTDQKLWDPAHWELGHWRSLEPVPPFMSKVSGKLV